MCNFVIFRIYFNFLEKLCFFAALTPQFVCSTSQYYSIATGVFTFGTLVSSQKRRDQNIMSLLDFLNLKILTLCQYWQVIYHRKGKILCFSIVYTLFRFVQYSSEYHELNMVKLLKIMNAWRFFCLVLPVACNLVEIKNISSEPMCMDNISFKNILYVL